MNVRIKTICADEKEFVRVVAEKIFSAYNEYGRDGAMEDVFNVWNICLARRAGVFGVEESGRRVCVKLFYDDGLKACSRNFFRCSKAKRAWRCGVKLLKCHLSVPMMIGYAENEKGMGLMITKFVEDSVRLDIQIEENEPRKSVAVALGRFVRQMHDAGVTHEDLSLRNVLVHKNGAAFVLLDYEDARFYKTVSEKQRLDNLHHLNERALTVVPESIRRAFLSAYLKDEKEISRWCTELKNRLVRHPSKYISQNW